MELARAGEYHAVETGAINSRRVVRFGGTLRACHKAASPHSRRCRAQLPLHQYSGGEGRGEGGGVSRENIVQAAAKDNPPHPRPSPPEYRGRGEPHVQCFLSEEFCWGVVVSRGMHALREYAQSVPPKNCTPFA